MYKCIESFVIDIVDGDGFTIEESGDLVEEGSIWEINEEAINILDADIHLENENSWIEISREILEQCFIKIK